MSASIHTRLTERFGLRHPIVGAPMGGVSGAALCAAVSRAGGLGMIGAGYGDPVWLHRELNRLRECSLDLPWGVGIITWSTGRELLDDIIDARPHVVMVSFGDATEVMSRLRGAGIPVIAQVQSVAAARAARDAGADFIVAQGTEAGGHGAQRATLPLVPAVVDAVKPLPVIAAGGIADGRGLAAALMLGAEGALIGTRLYASPEALGHERAKQRLLDARGDDTQRTQVYDIVRGLHWPQGYTGRAVRNAFSERWHGREAALEAEVDGLRDGFFDAQQRGDIDTAMVWAGEAVDLVRELRPAAELVQTLADEAAALLAAAPRRLA